MDKMSRKKDLHQRVSVAEKRLISFFEDGLWVLIIELRLDNYAENSVKILMRWETNNFSFSIK